MSLDIAAGRLCVNKNKKTRKLCNTINQRHYFSNKYSCFGCNSFACDKEKWHCSDIYDCLHLHSDIAEIVTRRGISST